MAINNSLAEVLVPTTFKHTVTSTSARHVDSALNQKMSTVDCSGLSVSTTIHEDRGLVKAHVQSLMRKAISSNL
jgi:hypothetical protein